MTIFVICRDWGYQGLSEPSVAFDDEQQARAYAAHIARSGESHKLFKVPIFPEIMPTEEVK